METTTLKLIALTLALFLATACGVERADEDAQNGETPAASGDQNPGSPQEPAPSGKPGFNGQGQGQGQGGQNGAPPAGETPPTATGDAFGLLGVGFQAPAGYTAASQEDLSSTFNKDGNKEIWVMYEWSLSAETLQQQATQPLVIDQEKGLSLNPVGSPENLAGGGLLQKFAATFQTQSGSQTLTAILAGLPRGDGEPGGLLVAGLTNAEAEAEAVAATVHTVAASVQYGAVQQATQALAYLEQGQWHNEDYYYSGGGVGSGSSSTHSYYCFKDGRYAYCSNSNISIDVSGASGYGNGEGAETGRVYVFSAGEEALIVMINEATGAISQLKAHLMPESSAFKTGEKTFYELTGRSCG